MDWFQSKWIQTDQFTYIKEIKMRKIFILIFLLIISSGICSAKTVTEDPTGNIIPIVLYGKGASTLIPIKVAADGSVYINGGSAGGGWTTDSSTKTTTTYNVGIGSTSPQSALDVNGWIYSSGSTVSGAGNIISNTYPANKIAFADNSIYIRVDPSMYTNGFIGIGTSAPRQKLDVEGSVYVLTNIGIGTTVPATQLQVGSGTVSATLVANSVHIQGDLEVDGEIYDTKVSTGVGHAQCYTTIGAAGYCTTVVGATGLCTCVPN